jgi:hypothetical protein
MADNKFVIGAAVDVEQLATGMNEATDVTKQALDNMLATFQEASSGTSRAVARISDDTRAAAVEVDASWKRVAEASLGYSAALKEVSAATYLARKAGEDDAATTNLLAAAKRGAAAAAKELAEANEIAGVGINGAAEAGEKARASMALMGEEMGVHVPRHLRGFIAELPGVGAAMSAAFSVFAVVGLIEVLGHLAEKAFEVGETLKNFAFGWEFQLELMAKATDNVKEHWEQFLVELDVEKLGIAVAGMKGPEKFAAEITNAQKATAIYGDELAKLQKRADDLKETLTGKHMQEVFVSIEPPVVGELEVGNTAGMSKDKVTELEKEWEKLAGAGGLIEQYKKKIATLQEVKIPTLQVEQSAGGQDKRLEEWKAELVAMKDAESGFHELSKEDEAGFWRDKLEIANGNAKLYGEVNHLMREAQRAEQKEGLKDEEAELRDRLAAAKQGSAERVAILSEEAGYLKLIGAEQTDFSKRIQAELTGATHAYAEEQGKVTVELERQKVEATRKGSEERLAAERAVLAELEAQHLQETAQYTAQLRRVTEAVQAAAQERLKLEQLEIEQARIAGIAKVQVERQNLQTEFDVHRINAQQRVAALKELEDEEYAILKAALEKQLTLAEQNPFTSRSELQRMHNAIENLTREHNNKLAQLDTQATKESMQRFDQFFQHISQGFQTAINGMLTGTKSFSKGMQDLWNSLVAGFVQSLTKMALSWAQHEIAKLIVHQTTNEGIVASDAAAAAQSQSISLTTALKHIAHAAASAAAHAFKSVMEYVPFPLNIVLAPVAAAGAFAGVLAFQGLASAREGMVSEEEQLAFVHKNEMVLPAPLALGFQSIIAGLSGAPAAAAAGGGAGNHIEFSGPTVYSPTNHYPASPTQDASAIARIVQKKIARKLGFNL